jgi:hypothetical protein
MASAVLITKYGLRIATYLIVAFLPKHNNIWISPPELPHFSRPVPLSHLISASTFFTFIVMFMSKFRFSFVFFFTFIFIFTFNFIFVFVFFLLF